MIEHDNFERAARNLVRRYYRRFPAMRSTHKWDATSVKDRWYRRRTCQFVRVRLAGAPHNVKQAIEFLKDFVGNGVTVRVVIETQNSGE